MSGSGEGERGASVGDTRESRRAGRWGWRRARGLAVLFLVSILLTWAIALVMAFVTDPRRGAAAAGETVVNGTTHASIQTWESATSSYVESAWTFGFKRAWGPEQAAGAPDTHGQGDIQTAWASATPDGQPEWLSLRWSSPIEATGVSVYQTYNPGAISRISVALGDGTEETVWTADAPPPGPGGASAASILVARLSGPKRIDRVKVYIDSGRVPGWNEIDAVCLTDTQGKSHGADDVTASSTYADRSGPGALPSIPSWCSLDKPSEAMTRGGVLFERRSAGAFGWPLRAWIGTQSTVQVRGGAAMGWAPAAGPMRTIPYRPILTGVLVNAGLIFLVLLALRLALLTPLKPARQLLRMQRGVCLRCGYDLRYNFAGGCPECGFMRGESA